ncbi:MULTISPECIES: DUF3422 family protein [Thalassolituus]|uniref:Uncharacterized membrane-anchored protein n=1 Tax=Thalassolituus maritimus TaxID=484498 RepID=A0A1N7N1J3_9GAMM|nr:MULTISPECIES: DUF3422 domain-containing protein [Thalassolituus]KZY98131.1 hypothetical protein A3746_07600 [Oleibacter sp. HI0075]MEC9410202.1 DUF3422 domain-containing protein [Pseudomonadota bacterium]HCG80438.1 DUF3422 domain-containing protein [Oceanospirillales bacterium]MED5441904.1 DUF3422 domain-containing protein [Pseudomonadota bacterium]MEE3159338.1 DUF3422 domain-containing protein [Pseudomonadota bacterium]|tara:strand:- start:1296 stop:2660 length:1365 start_codon:yes stop_codon:yes gene_type:complete
MKHAIQEVASEAGTPEISAPAVSLRVHPQRSSLYEELHNRPSPIIEGGCQVTHFTVMLDNNREEILEHVNDLCRRYSVPAPGNDSSCLYQDFGGFELRWERHLEFANFTFISKDAAPFSDDALAFIPKDWLASMPGELVVAVNLVMVESEPSDVDLKRWFEGQRVSGSEVAENKAQVWTAFKLHSDGFGRIVAWNRDLNAYQAGRMVQRLCELETYRLMSLLALPVAREMGAELSRIEDNLATLNLSISEIDKDKDERELLQELSHLAAEVERHRSDTNFRFSASVAYHDLVRDRIKQLQEVPMDGVQSLQEFLERRLTPGIKTCNSVRDRLEDLSRRIHRTTSLLRTRVDLSIQEQNQHLLSSMNRRSQLQLRLQQTVEGLSVVAIGYYLLSLLEIAFNGLKAVGVPIDVSLAKGVAMPVVLLLVLLGVRSVRTHITRRNRAADGNSGKSERQ